MTRTCSTNSRACCPRAIPCTWRTRPRRHPTTSSASRCASRHWASRPRLTSSRVASSIRSDCASDCAALVAGGVEQALLVAGDLATPSGPFTSTLDLLDSGVLRDVGIKRLGVAGHPEGHPSVADEILWQALERKQAYGRASGLKMHIATQFGFDARSLANFESRRWPSARFPCPSMPGSPGPRPSPSCSSTRPDCGVGASLKAVAGNSLSLGRLPHLVTRSDEMLLGVYRAKQPTPIRVSLRPISLRSAASWRRHAGSGRSLRAPLSWIRLKGGLSITNLRRACRERTRRAHSSADRLPTTPSWCSRIASGTTSSPTSSTC